MAAAIKALNARIRANPVADYFCSTREFLHFTEQEEKSWNGRVSLIYLKRHFLDDSTDTNVLRADFWGPASNFGIPIAAVMDTQKDPEMYVRSHHPSPPKRPHSHSRLVLPTVTSLPNDSEL